MAAVTICSDFGAQKNKVWHYFHCFPIYFPWSGLPEILIPVCVSSSPGIQKDGNYNPVFRAAKEIQMYRIVFWTLWERARVGWLGRMTLNHVYYHMWNESPVQVWCMIQDAWGWCTGLTQRDGICREVGGGFRMRNTCIHMVDSCQCMANPYNIVK